MKRLFKISYMCMATLFLTASLLYAKEWSKQEIPESAQGLNLYSVSFPDSMHGWAVGEKGVILSTDDGGETWLDISANLRAEATEAIQIPLTLNLYSVIFLDQMTGWCAGEAVLATMDPAGRSFGVIFHTEDGGLTWRCQYPALITESCPDSCGLGRINDIYFLDRLNGMAVGTGFSYLVTSDGGVTWEEEGLNFSVIPEMRMSMTSSKWLLPCMGMITGYSYDMNFPERRTGFIATTRGLEPECRSEWIWDWETAGGNEFPQLNDIELKAGATRPLQAWAAGRKGTILKRNREGEWERYLFPWPLAFTLPEFNGMDFPDAQRGWTVGFFRKGVHVDPEQVPPYMTVFKTLDAGNTWQPEALNIKGVLNDVDAVNTRITREERTTRIETDVWAVGNEGAILHYRNHPPLICTLNVTPGLVYAGQRFILQARVDDLDNPFEDIASVTVDASSLGLGTIELEFAGGQTDGRRCILYEAVVEVPPLAEYGNHILTVTVRDKDNAMDRSETSVFVVTSWVDILEAWAKPETVMPGCGVTLNAKVILVAPKDSEDDPSLCHNRIESVKVNVSDLLGLDCDDETDCDAWITMEYDPSDKLYKTKTVAIVPGIHNLPVIAKDSLGHIDRDSIKVYVLLHVLRFDSDFDNDVDGVDLNSFIASGDYDRPDNMMRFSREYGMMMPCRPFIGETP